MSVSRRQFLLNTAGASVGAIIPSFYFRALEYLEQLGQPLLVAPARATQDLWVVTQDDQLELCLGDPFAEPPELTWAEFITRYEPETLYDFEGHWDITEEQLHLPLEGELRMDQWFFHEGPMPQAHKLLRSLDLGSELSGPNAVGGLDIYQECNMVSSWRGARADDEITLSLLQRRLNDLGTGIGVVIGPVL